MSLSEADIIKSDINTSEISTVDPSNILECLPIGSKLHLPQKLTTNISSVRRNIGVEGIVAIGRLAFPDPP
ncbi:unnamed protein product [Aspergillus oryzae]|nr:unnamed protein product [Aspergillus oryzae]GMF92735.1 unnamed protein product [Aspergillus oryzae]GMG08709.1 unnamed protein product [Aspergillus oryzae]GMG33278.1 unnamed protein product [Aspergillus oryzae]GMG49483.1 unnamed protein product [Aspergillus oryzae var. brunneus]